MTNAMLDEIAIAADRAFDGGTVNDMLKVARWVPTLVQALRHANATKPRPETWKRAKRAVYDHDGTRATEMELDLAAVALARELVRSGWEPSR